MNRIAGIFNLDGAPVDPGDLTRMSAALAPEGRTQHQLWIEGSIGFIGTTSRMAQSAKEQAPSAVRSYGRYVLALDGRIDNRSQLSHALKPDLDAPDNATSDGHLILAAYQRWGQAFAEHLLGDFALAIWDYQARSLVCARDHLGIKPFYYHASNRHFVFASSPIAVLASGKSSWSLNEGRIADFLLFSWEALECIDKTSTFYNEVVRLEPAHALSIRNDHLTSKRYWRLSPRTQGAATTEAEYVEEFRELFTESVRCRLPVDGPSASTLSGGIDSSSIVAITRQLVHAQGKEAVHTFSAVSQEPGTGEDTRHVGAVLSQGHVQAHMISEADVLRQVDELRSMLETEVEPFACFGNMPRAILLCARDQGIGSLMSGIDGDILLLDPWRIHAWLWRHGDFRSALAETLMAGGVASPSTPSWGLFFHSLRAALAPEWLRRLRLQRRCDTAVRSATASTIINRDFAARCRLNERLSRLYSHRALPASSSLLDVQRRSIESPCLTVALEKGSLQAGELGIEVRFPLLDVRLAEFSAALPWHLQTRRGWTKLILRRAVEPLLPRDVVWRRDKTGLGLHFNLLILDTCANQFRAIVHEEEDHLKAYVDTNKLLRVWDEYSTLGIVSHPESLWYGAALAMWLRQQRRLGIALD